MESMKHEMEAIKLTLLNEGPDHEAMSKYLSGRILIRYRDPILGDELRRLQGAFAFLVSMGHRIEMTRYDWSGKEVRRITIAGDVDDHENIEAIINWKCLTLGLVHYADDLVTMICKRPAPAGVQTPESMAKENEVMTLSMFPPGTDWFGTDELMINPREEAAATADFANQHRLREQLLEWCQSGRLALMGQ
jgi:hypothetical protein